MIPWFISALIILFLLSPYIMVFRYVGDLQIKNMEEVLWAMKNTLVQSFGSAVLALIVGFLGMLGILALQKDSKKRAIFESLVLLPGFLPPLFFILILLDTFNNFPIGILGISIAHGFINFGVVAVVLARIVEDNFVRYSEIALTLGVSPLRFWLAVIFPLLKKDLWILFLFVFSISYASFSIPLILGGGRGVTLEVLIYERLRNNVDWGSALTLSFIQAFGIFVLGFVRDRRSMGTNHSIYPLRLSGSYWAFLLISFGLIFLLSSYFISIWEARIYWQESLKILMQSADSIGGTLVISLSSGLAFYCLLMLITYRLPDWPLETFLRGYIAPSTAVACLGFLVIGTEDPILVFFKIVMVFCILYLGTLFKLGVGPKLSELSSQISTAKLLGASRFLIFCKIIFPQINSRIILYSGIAAVWAAGDFGVTKILGFQEITFALIVQSLLSTYRLELASLLSFFLLLICLGVFLLFYGVSRVCDQKLKG